MNEKKINNLLEFILYFLLGTLTSYVGLIAALFIAYISNYKKYGRIIIGFLIGSLIYGFFIGPNLTSIGDLVYSFIVGIIAVGIAYMIREDRSKDNPTNG